MSRPSVRHTHAHVHTIITCCSRLLFNVCCKMSDFVIFQSQFTRSSIAVHLFFHPPGCHILFCPSFLVPLFLVQVYLTASPSAHTESSSVFLIVMVPVPHSRSNVPSRTRFMWELRNCPWTDGKVPQEGYDSSVYFWSDYHDNFPISNANKIPNSLRCFQLMAQLFFHAADLIKYIPRTTIIYEDGVDAIVAELNKRDPFPVFSEVFDYTTL